MLVYTQTPFTARKSTSGVDVADVDQVPRAPQRGEHHGDAPTDLGNSADLAGHLQRRDSALKPQDPGFDPLDPEGVLHPVVLGVGIGVLDDLRGSPGRHVLEHGLVCATQLLSRVLSDAHGLSAGGKAERIRRDLAREALRETPPGSLNLKQLDVDSLGPVGPGLGVE